MGAKPSRGANGCKSDGCTTPQGSDASISLEDMRVHAGNPAMVVARYHSEEAPGRSLHLEDDYEVSAAAVLGRGCSGPVVIATRRLDGRKYALKRFSKRHLSGNALGLLKAEVEIYMILDHPNIARLHDVYDSEGALNLVMECCTGGELFERLAQVQHYTEPQAAQAMTQMLRAVCYLHSHDVVHRDLKLENFLYESPEKDAVLKLIDFGLAKIWDPKHKMRAMCGSLDYISPDILSGRGYTSKCDLWSLGVIAFMLLGGYPPFHGTHQATLTKIKRYEPDWCGAGDRWTHISKEAVHFVKQLLNKDAAARPDAAAALRHPWLAPVLSPRGPQPPAIGQETLASLRHYAKSSKVRRAALQLLAQELAPDECRELRELFLSLDHDNTGTISLSTLKEAIRRCREVQKKTEDSPWSMLSWLRASQSHSNSSTTVSGITGEDSTPDASPLATQSCADALDCPKRTITTGSLAADYGELFHSLDANGDSEVNYSDFLAATIEVRSRLREEAMHRVFQRLDLDGSGSIGVADLRQAIGDTFEGVDAEELLNTSEVTLDGRGEITYEEFVRLLEAQGQDDRGVDGSVGAVTKTDSKESVNVDLIWGGYCNF